MMAANLWGRCPPTWLLPWVGAVGARQFRRDAACAAPSRSPASAVRAGGCPTWLMVGEVALRAAVWLSLPLYLFPSLDPGTQVIAASIMAGLGIGALGLVVVPPCATAWMVAFTAGVGGALLIGRAHACRSSTCCRSSSRSGVAIFGVLTVARWAFHQLKTNADVGSQSESASLLLQEYEQRGVGWLWQVDGENRVTYISSRMSALLGTPGQPADRPFAARAARRPCRARPGAAREAAVQLARDGAQDAARHRAGSRSPATRSSTPPAASRASAESAPTSPRSARRRSG